MPELQSHKFLMQNIKKSFRENLYFNIYLKTYISVLDILSLTNQIGLFLLTYSKLKSWKLGVLTSITHAPTSINTFLTSITHSNQLINIKIHWGMCETKFLSNSKLI